MQFLSKHRRPIAGLAILAVMALLSAVSDSTNRSGLAGPAAVDLAADGDGATATGDGSAPVASEGLVVDDPATPEIEGAIAGPGGSSPPAGAGGTAGRGGAGSPAGPPSGRGVPSAGFTGPGVTASEIKIGITTIDAGTLFGDATGVPINFGNTRAQAEAVVDHLNRNGGMAGRTIKPVFYKFDLTRPGLSDGQSEQEACAAWTEDERVFAAVNTVLARQALLFCLAKRGVPGVHAMPIDEETLKTYRDYWYSSFGGSALTLDRLAVNQVKVFAAQGFYGPDAVVGIQHFDDAAYKRVVEESFKPALAAAGVKKVVLQAAPRGGVEATSYVVNFRNQGVTHVHFLGEGGAYPLFFMRAAEDQQYFPKYGLHTDQALAQLLQPGAPTRQLANVTAMGWTPVGDVDNAHDPGPVNQNNALCLDIQKKAGQDMSNRAAMTTAILYCDGLFLLSQALAPARQITVGGLAAGVAALAGSYGAPGVFGTRFSRTKHDGAEAYRDVKFQTQGGCNCFVYTSPTKTFPA